MSLLHYLIISFIQAITEFLPISSSGHLLLYKGLFNINDIPIVFDIVVHIGSMVAIVVFYRQKIISMFTNSWSELLSKQEIKPNTKILFYIIFSTVVTFIFYVLFKKSIESLYQSPSILFVTFLFTSIILFFTCLSKQKERSLIYTSNWGIILPIIVGLFQGFAIMPGVSRSGATISPLLLMGIRREEAVFYSFCLAVPAILGAFISNLLKMENIAFISNNFKILIFSLIVSFVFSYVFLNILIYIVRQGRFWIFSFYTLLLAIISLIVF